MNMRVLGLLVAAAVFLVDQVAKYYVTGPLGLNVQDASLTVLPRKMQMNLSSLVRPMAM